MNERLICIPLPSVFPGASAALGDGYGYYYCRHDLTVVYVSAAPSVDDPGLTLDINDDGTAIIAALSCADADIPGEWESTHVGGTETPVTIAAGSKISFDANAAANATQIVGYILALVGEKTA